MDEEHRPHKLYMHVLGTSQDVRTHTHVYAYIRTHTPTHIHTYICTYMICICMCRSIYTHKLILDFMCNQVVIMLLYKICELLFSFSSVISFVSFFFFVLFFTPPFFMILHFFSHPSNILTTLQPIIKYHINLSKEQKAKKLNWFYKFPSIINIRKQEDICFLTEDDNRYWMGIEKTASDRFFIVSVESKETTEAHIVDLEGVTGKYVRTCVCACIRLYACKLAYVRACVPTHSVDLFC